MRTNLIPVVLPAFLAAAWLVSAAAAVAQTDSPESRLQKLGIDPSRAGIEQYLKSLAEDDLAEKTDALIAELSDPEFKVRERAAQQLLSLAFPPLEKLEAATKSSDAETAFRAKLILTKLKSDESPVRLALRVVEAKKLDVGVPLLLKVRARAGASGIQQACLQAALAIVKKSDRAEIEALTKDSNASQSAAARLLLAQLDSPTKSVLKGGKFDAVRVQPGSISGGGSNLIDGWEFTAKSDLVVTQLGIYDNGVDGLAAAHEVAIWDIEDSAAPVALGTVPAGQEAPRAGRFRCVPVAPATLKAGKKYAIVAHYPVGDDSTVSLTNPQGLTLEFAEHVEVHARRYSFPHKEMAFPSQRGSEARDAHIGPTFRYDEAEEKQP